MYQGMVKTYGVDTKGIEVLSVGKAHLLPTSIARGASESRCGTASSGVQHRRHGLEQERRRLSL